MDDQDKTMEETQFNCMECSKPDDHQTMVACDTCHGWWHFSCVGVDSSVKNRPWSCQACRLKSQNRSSSQSGKSGKSTASQINLKMRKLEEEQMLNLNILAEKEKVHKEFIGKKYALLAEEAVAGEEEDGSVRSYHSSRNVVQQWLKDHPSTQMQANVAGSAPVTSGNEVAVNQRTVNETTATLLSDLHTTSQDAPKSLPTETPVRAYTGTVPRNVPAQPTVALYPAVRSTPVNTSMSMCAPVVGHYQAAISNSNPMSTMYPTSFGPRMSSTVQEPITSGIGLSQPTLPWMTKHRHDQCHQVPLPSSSGAGSTNRNDQPWQYPVSSVPNSNPYRPSTSEQYNQPMYPLLSKWIDGPQPAGEAVPVVGPSARIDHQIATGHGRPEETARSWNRFQHQITARQAAHKELPIFSGEPEEWPLFICSYRNSTEMCDYTDAENLLRLQRCLRGNALEAVRSNLMEPASVPVVISTLEQLFGNPQRIIAALLQKVRTAPSPKTDRLDSLIQFGVMVQNLVGHMKSAQLHTHLANPTLLQELVEKLPANLQLDWALFLNRVDEPDLGVFNDYLSVLVKAASKVTFTKNFLSRPAKADRKDRDKAFVNIHAPTTEPNSERKAIVYDHRNDPKPCFVCGSSSHRIRDCTKLKSLAIHARWQVVIDNKLCHQCLIPHGKWSCRSKRKCDVNRCGKDHHPLLHPGPPEETAVVAIHQQLQTPVLFRIIPVVLYKGNLSIETHAFLDEGSSTTLLEESIASKLGVDGVHAPLCLLWTGNVTRKENRSQKVSLEISGCGGGARMSLKNVRTVVNLELPTQSLDYEKLAENFPYLSKLPVQSYQNASPKLLIGLDNFHVAVSSKAREGRADQPLATKSRLGWTIFGNVGPKSCSSILAPQLHISECKSEPDLHDYVKRFFTVESLGISTIPAAKSEDELRAVGILEETTMQLDDGHYETALLWKYDEVKLPPSYDMAFGRLRCLERRLAKNPDMKANVSMQIDEYLRKGYAHKATTQDLETNPDRVWYLPLGVVINPKKPKKTRLIWDAAAKSNNISLNDMLLKGPDLLIALPAVLYRFRQKQVCITGDIREMFHQIRIRSQDRQAQRFLWRRNVEDKPEVYVMDVATFGATCSPSLAQYVKNVNAKRWEQKFPEAVDAIVNSHYMDDYAASRDSVEELVELTKSVRQIHASGGFELRNFLSNSEAVLRQIGEGVQSEIKQFAEDKENDYERVLGMTWFPKTDEFGYTVALREDLMQLITGEKPLTKRSILKFVMSLFDPLGFMAHFLIQGKLILQTLWRKAIMWDEVVPTDVEVAWERWIKVFKNIGQVRIPRCYFPDYDVESYRSIQLHVFVDGSENAYSAVAYFRIIDRDQVRCSLITSKAKVAPLKPMSIPRIELQAAVIGSRLIQTVESLHTIPIAKKFLWTDSCTVLSWIQSDARKFRQFVAFRIGEILEHTRPDQWRWVPTKQNVADEATKWLNGPSLDSKSRWFKGPGFLYLSEEQWPKQSKHVETVEEIRPMHLHKEIVFDSPIAFENFSKWERLLRTMSYMLHWRNIVRHRNKTAEGLTQEDFQSAERTIWNMVQRETYPDEMILLGEAEIPEKSCRKIEKNSPIRKLTPFLDKWGVLRMQSRIELSPCVPYDMKYPIILPKTHRVTQLLVDWYHRKYAHGNSETIVNEIRQRFHISNLRAVVQRAAKNCCWCKVYKARPEAPRMAPLPEDRLTAGGKPFSVVGIDYFGPYNIKIGRSRVKRWVALFTCLVVRAVHLEAVTSLSTESCKLAIRRFIARRGPPAKIYTDNGTNFLGASRELEDQIVAINQGLASIYTDAETQWCFIPPVTPHMGGAWERMVRSVKSAMSTFHESRSPTDEVFATVLCEVESIVNSRPLTHLPLETSEQESLTPNHFLLLNSNGTKKIEKVPTDEREALRSGWNQCQRMADLFWQRWVREYLPTLTRRTKWHDDVKPIAAGDLVVIIDDGIRNRWVRGLVLQTKPGRDGRARSAYVQTSQGVLKRPIVKLAVLDVQGSDEATPPQ
ncbi:uncharacterized protein LOC129752524 [Uranotaenia lowii]|uniref:uncharacterized protein LOC129752524 n=1 Tax=Uranotaenia lowii TaxID=190385 RepID=UPI002478ED4F|nr:uncharacterized protein LOC129752524 [Uranotaenia lowii]